MCLKNNIMSLSRADANSWPSLAHPVATSSFKNTTLKRLSQRKISLLTRRRDLHPNSPHTIQLLDITTLSILLQTTPDFPWLLCVSS